MESLWIPCGLHKEWSGVEYTGKGLKVDNAAILYAPQSAVSALGQV